MGNLQNNSIASFVVAAKGVSPPGLTNTGTLYVFNGRNGTWPGQLNLALDGTTEGFTAYGPSGNPVATALRIGGDFDQDGNSDIITTTTNTLYDIYHQPNPLNTPLNLALLNGTNGGISLQGLQVGSEFGNTIALIDINNDGLPDVVTLDMMPENNERRKTGIRCQRVDHGHRYC
jgi:hypothetical protein